MPAPVTTLNQTAIAAGSHAAAATREGDINITTKFEAEVQVEIQFPATINNDPEVRALRAIDSTSTPTFDTLETPVLAFTIARVASATRRKSFVLPTGMWRIQIENKDGTNALTSSSAKYSTIDSV